MPEHLQSALVTFTTKRSASKFRSHIIKLESKQIWNEQESALLRWCPQHSNEDWKSSPCTSSMQSDSNKTHPLMCMLLPSKARCSMDVSFSSNNSKKPFLLFSFFHPNMNFTLHLYHVMSAWWCGVCHWLGNVVS